MKLHGWGRYPIVDSKIHVVKNATSPRFSLEQGFRGIAYGMGRSYGDSALSDEVLAFRNLNHLLDFNPKSGVVRTQAGVTLKELIDTFTPKGWFLPVTPGTQYVTVGGAIASDVHGKNHHKEGSFSDFVDEMTVLLPDGSRCTCSREKTPELFRATAGGMGLTGFILDATIRLKPISSAYVDTMTIKAENLEEALELFEKYKQITYSVAWIDTLASGRKMGRSLVMLGEHSTDGKLSVPPTTELAIPIDFPEFALNPLSVSLFNRLYFNKVFEKKSTGKAPYEAFFHPLDAILQWNRMYGRSGFTQYQFVIPKSETARGLKKILSEIAKARMGSFLAVLKLFGEGNDNYLSFPMEGYTLALDFAIRPGVLEVLNRLDNLVLEHGGRLYLTKDVRMSEATFKQGYPNWKTFDELRAQIGAKEIFNSKQSQRLGL